MRASRATELANEYSPHVAAAWLGHSTAIANKHYWQVTDADIQKAIASVKPDANQAAQKAAQQALAMSGKELQTVDNEVRQTAIFPSIANRCDHLQYQFMGDEGLEPPLRNTDKTPIRDRCGAQSGAVGAQEPPFDPELEALIEAWPILSPAIKAGIVAMVGAAK